MTAPAETIVKKPQVWGGKAQVNDPKEGVNLDAEHFSLQRTVGNNAVYHLLDPEDRFSTRALQLPTGATQVKKNPVNEMGLPESVLRNATPSYMPGGGAFEQQLIVAALSGFKSEMFLQLTIQKKGDRIDKFYEELKQPSVIAAYVGGYIGGYAAGMVSPVTMLFSLPAFADAVDDFVKSIPESINDLTLKLVDEGCNFVIHFKEFEGKFNASLNTALQKIMLDIIRSKNSINYNKIIEQAGNAAMQMSSGLGRGAATNIIKLLESPLEKEQGWESILPKDPKAVVKNPGWAVWATISRGIEYGSEKVKKNIFSTPWSKVGYEIGNVVGIVTSNLLLFAATDGIGNAISLIGGALSKLTPALRLVGTVATKIGKVLEVVGGVITSAENALGLVVSTILKPLEKVFEPLLALLMNFRSWLRGLLGFVEKEGIVVAAELGGNAATKIKSAPVAPKVVEPLPPTTTSVKAVEPLSPPTTSVKAVEPLPPPTTSVKAVEPLPSPPTTTSVKAVEPLSPPTTSVKAVKPLSPPTTSVKAVEPLPPPTTTSVKAVEPLPPTTVKAVELPLPLTPEELKLINAAYELKAAKDQANQVNAGLKELERQGKNKTDLEYKKKLEESSKAIGEVVKKKNLYEAELRAQGISHKQLYKRLRNKTPNTAMKRVAKDTPCPYAPGKSPDHIVPFDDIIDMPGFNKLPPDIQIEIINMPENTIGMTFEANSSKGDKLWSAKPADTSRYWEGHLDAGVIHPEVRMQMGEMESQAKAALQNEINKHLKKLGLL